MASYISEAIVAFKGKAKQRYICEIFCVCNLKNVVFEKKIHLQHDELIQIKFKKHISIGICKQTITIIFKHIQTHLHINIDYRFLHKGQIKYIQAFCFEPIYKLCLTIKEKYIL